MATTNKAQDNNPNSGSTNSVATPSNPANQIQSQFNGQKNFGTPQIDVIPDVRKTNILSKFSSYTYGITLYMCTPEAYNLVFGPNADQAGLFGGVLDKTIPGIYIVAQSGGINNQTEKRALTFGRDLDSSIDGSNAGYDYYIDDLSIDIAVPGGTGTPTVATEVTFKIVEPIGFNFLTALSAAGTALNNLSEITKSMPAQPNVYQQNYILGISFYGYDVNGNLVKATDPLVSNFSNGYGSDNAVIQRYFPIQLSTVNFKLTGGATVYNCEGTVLPYQVGFGQVNATVTKPTELRAATVREAIEGVVGQRSNSVVSGLLQIMNEEKEDLKLRGKTELNVTYSVEFEPGSGIDTAKILDDNEVDARTAPMAGVSRTNQVTVSESYKSTTIDTVRKRVSVAQGTNIAAVIDNIIVKSSYISDALNEVNSSNPETVSDEKTGVKKLNWFTVNPVVSITGRDAKTNMWCYHITYQIRTYKIPYIRTQYKQLTDKYYGPFKLYEYWLTGGNSEVLAYEQAYNNLYYVSTPISTSSDANAGNDKQGPQTPTSPQGGTNYNNTSGKPNRGSEINNAVAAQLYSPADQAEADIKILGDPDLLMTRVGQSANLSAKSFYAPDKSIDPLNAQVFIEIVFNTATDYNKQGLLEVTDKIQFYSSAKAKKSGIKGIVYKLVKVQSTFSRGQFIQQLHAVLVPENELVTDTNTAQQERQELSNQTENQSAAETARLGRQGMPTSGNITSEVMKRTGVDLTNSSAGAGRGRGPTAQELAAMSAQSANDDRVLAEQKAIAANQAARDEPSNQQARLEAFNARREAERARLTEITKSTFSQRLGR